MKKFIPITIFAIAMGFLEAAVVVYARQIYYPHGFSFPLNPNIEKNILLMEWLREICTIVMLACIGILSAENFIKRLCYFLSAFGIWDIFYYIGLKIFLNWPESLLTWDILFLIPVPWVGPVLAPVICSLTMIFLAINIIFIDEKYKVLLKGKFVDWLLVILGSFIIYSTFTIDFTKLIITGGFITKFSTLTTNPEFAKAVSLYKPEKFLWFLFVIGELLILISFFKTLYENRKKLIKEILIRI
jgi:hypothetical protein